MARRLSSERGVALPLALAVMLITSLTVFAALDYSTANIRHAGLSHSKQDARGIAEGGLNRAAALLHENPDTPGLPSCTAAPVWSPVEEGDVRWCGDPMPGHPLATDDDVVWSVRGESRVRNRTGAAQLGHTVTAELIVRTRTEVEVVSVPGEPIFDAGPWNYLFSAPTGCAFIKNSAVVRNPIYIRGKLCLLNNGVFRSSPLYVKSQVRPPTAPACDPLYPGNCAGDWDPKNEPGAIYVDSSTASVGLPPTHPEAYAVPDIRVEVGCAYLSGTSYSASAVNINNCVAAKRVYSQTYPVRQDPPDYAMPKISWQDVYTESAPGSTARGHRCWASSKSNLEAMNSAIGSQWNVGGTWSGTGSLSGTSWPGGSRVLDTNTTPGLTGSPTLGPIDFFPSSAYECEIKRADGSMLGRIHWNPTTKILRIEGVLYFDGYANVVSKQATIRGLGTIYLSGTLLLDGAKICGKGISAGWCIPGCSPAQIAADDRTCWNPNGHDPASSDQEDRINMVYIAANGTSKATDTAITMQNGADYQGGLFSGGHFIFKSSSPASRQYGPILTRELTIENSGIIAGFPALSMLAPGLPGGSYTPGPVEETETTVTIRSVHLVPGSWRG